MLSSIKIQIVRLQFSQEKLLVSFNSDISTRSPSLKCQSTVFTLVTTLVHLLFSNENPVASFNSGISTRSPSLKYKSTVFSLVSTHVLLFLKSFLIQTNTTKIFLQKFTNCTNVPNVTKSYSKRTPLSSLKLDILLKFDVKITLQIRFKV